MFGRIAPTARHQAYHHRCQPGQAKRLLPLPRARLLPSHTPLRRGL